MLRCVLLLCLFCFWVACFVRFFRVFMSKVVWGCDSSEYFAYCKPFSLGTLCFYADMCCVYVTLCSVAAFVLFFCVVCVCLFLSGWVRNVMKFVCLSPTVLSGTSCLPICVLLKINIYILFAGRPLVVLCNNASF